MNQNEAPKRSLPAVIFESLPACRCGGTGIMSVSERYKGGNAGRWAERVVCTCPAGKFVAAFSYGGSKAGEVLPRL